MTWRYQSVFEKIVEWDEERHFIIEVYFDDDGTFYGWTEEVEPFGSTQQELLETLQMQLKDCSKYKSVEHGLIKVGMTFEEI